MNPVPQGNPQFFHHTEHIKCMGELKIKVTKEQFYRREILNFRLPISMD